MFSTIFFQKIFLLVLASVISVMLYKLEACGWNELLWVFPSLHWQMMGQGRYSQWETPLVTKQENKLGNLPLNYTVLDMYKLSHASFFECTLRQTLSQFLSAHPWLALFTSEQAFPSVPRTSVILFSLFARCTATITKTLLVGMGKVRHQLEFLATVSTHILDRITLLHPVQLSG